jgi:hypothetical protein
MSLSGAEVAVVCAGNAEEPNGAARTESSVEMTFLLMDVEIREDELRLSGCKSRSRALQPPRAKCYIRPLALYPFPE